MFQANPKRYDLLGHVAGGIDDNWSMNQHRDLVTIGDTIYFFISGQAAGVYVVGRVVGPVFEADIPNEFGRWKVEVEYEAIVEPPLLRSELLADPVLRGWPPFKGQLRTNFIVPSDVAKALHTKLDGRLKPIPKGPGEGFDETAHAVNVAVATHQTKVREQMLDYLKSMPPAGFETLIRVLLEALGYEEAAVTGKTGDGGVDVVAVLRLHGMTSVPTVIQAKRWARPVAGDVVRQLRGALRVDEHGVVITTSRFTKDAIAEASASGKAPIGLVDGPKLVDLLLEQGIGVEKRAMSTWRLDTDALSEAGPGPSA
jgi:hypothetical protein